MIYGPTGQGLRLSIMVNAVTDRHNTAQQFRHRSSVRVMVSINLAFASKHEDLLSFVMTYSDLCRP